MYKLKRLEIAGLLERNANFPFAAVALLALGDPSILGHTTKPCPKGEILDTYRVRERNNVLEGSPVKGFEELLPALEAAGSEITISGLGVGKGQVIVFTDPDFEYLYGILYSTKPFIFSPLEVDPPRTSHS